MPKILISYRRADSDAIAGRIRDRLARRYGDHAVFMDIDNIPFGIDFREHIKGELASCDILVAVVGPKWLGPGEDGRLRVADGTDPVRIEIEATLQRKIPVIPVLVHHATMPAAGDLPDTMKSFAFYNAAEVDTGRDFHPHVDRLIRSMDRILKDSAKAKTSARRAWLFGGVAAACACLIAGGVWFYQARMATPPPTSPVVASATQPVPEPAVVQAPQPSRQPVTPPQPGRPAPLPYMQPWQAHHRIAAAELPALFDKLKTDGYRIRTINPYIVDGAEQYASLWIKDGGPDWQVRYGLTPGEFQKAGEDFRNEGYRTTWVSAHEFEGQLRYAGIYEKRSGPPWRVRYGITSAQLQTGLDELAKEGYQPIHLYGYAKAGVSNFAVIFEKGEGTAPPIKFDAAPADFQKFFEEQTRQGYRPKVVNGYRVGDQEYRAGLWEKVPGIAWYARTGAPTAAYLSLYDNMVYQGYRQLFLSVYSVGNTVRTASGWENLAFIGQLNAITSRMQNYVATHQVPGAAIAITKDGRLVYAGGFGLADRASNLDATPTSLFRIGGVSKTITAVAILKLVEAKKLSLDDKVFGPGGLLASRYPTPPFNKRIEQITVKHLLQHVSGFSNAPNDPISAYPHLPPDEIIRTVINDPVRALARNPGTQFEQSNFDYVVLGRVIEQVTGTTYEQYVKANVLAPAGIRDMGLGGDSAAARKPREVTYYPADAYSLKLHNMDAASGWVASAVELARFLVHVDGSPSKPDIISAASYKLMTTNSAIKAANDADPYYGLGWHVSPQSHNGVMRGSIAYVAVLPGDFTIVALANTRPASDESGQILQSTVRDVIAAVKAWPSYDLFEARPGDPVAAAR